jgi:WD40 repeat protein
VGSAGHDPTAKAQPEPESLQTTLYEPEPEAEGTVSDYYDKYSTGFVGSFGDANVFFGGLSGLVGDCRRDVLIAMTDEHCTVSSGYGTSDSKFITSNYKVETTPKEEWLFVYSPEMLPEALTKGLSQETGLRLGNRAKQPWQYFLQRGPSLISAKFAEAGYNVVVSAEEFSRLAIRQEEIIGLRLYTGPMFELYNGVLRAWANPGQPGIVPAFATIGKGLDVCGCFTSTLHAINSGVVKLSQLQPATVIFRGISGMKLPEPFLVRSKFNVRGGVEFGFMSCTLDEKVALRYAKTRPDEPSTLMVMEMGMVDRGAQLDWLSQYPEEREILLPPLTGMEVHVDEVTADDVRQLTMRLNINLRSTTLEQLLSARQKELSELAHMVHKDLRECRPEGDIPRRLARVDQMMHEISQEDAAALNENERFVRTTEDVLQQLPRRGDQLESLRASSGPVFALASQSTADEPMLISGSFDGSLLGFGKRQAVGGMSYEVAQCASPVLSVAALEPTGLVAAGLFSGQIKLAECGASSGRQVLGHSGGVTALAWLAERQWLASGSVDHDVMIWQLAAQDTQLRLCGHTDTVRAMCWIDGGRWLASGSLDCTTRLWDPYSPSSRPISVFQHAAAVTAAVDVGKVGGEQWLATGSADASITIWGLTTMQPVTRKQRSHDLGVCALAWLPEQRLLASGSADTTIKLWSMPADGSHVLRAAQVLRGHTGTVHALATVRSHGWLASGSADSSILIWRIDTTKHNNS